MIAHETADLRGIGGAKTSKNNAPIYPKISPENQEKIDIAETLGALNFIVENLDAAAHEATVAADAICEKNIAAGHYHVGRFAAHARAACGAFRDILGVPIEGGAQ
jgi:hypothetical protein